jgi:hypothetical protein
VSSGLVVSRSGDRVRNDTLGRLLLDAMAPVMSLSTEVTRTIGGMWRGITGACARSWRFAAGSRRTPSRPA